MQPQLLDLFVSSSSFTDYIPLGNENTFCLLQEQSTQFTHLTGAKFCGKSHLLQAWVNQAHTNGKTGIYINSQDKNLPLLRDLALKFSFIAIDMQQIELFDLFNFIKLNNRDNHLLTSSSQGLSHLPLLRPDLKTRLQSGVNLTLKPMNDEHLLQALNLFTTRNGIRLEQHEQNYLINHYTRNLGVLIQTIRKLAEIAVLKKRYITIPLIKQVLRQG